MLELRTTSNQLAWNYETNLDDKDAETKLNAAVKILATYVKESWNQNIKKYNDIQFNDMQLKRRFEMLSVLQEPALRNATYSKFLDILSYMSKIYGTGKVCPLTNRQCNKETEGLDLDPGLTAIISNPTNYSYEELQYVWAGWRNAQEWS